MSKSRVGRGLDDLLGALPSETPHTSANPEAGIVEIDLNAIETNPHQPRKHFNAEALEELALSITENGVLQPILLRKINFNQYQIIAGERRFRAAKLAKLTTIPAIVKNLKADEATIIALLENIQREDLKPIEEAKAYAEIINTLSISQQELAQKLSKNRSTIANSMRLLKLPLEIQAATEGGTISAGHARALLAVEDEERQQALFKNITKAGLSVRQLEALIYQNSEQANLSQEPTRVANNPAQLKRHLEEFKTIEENLITKLGTKVNLKGNYTKGKLEISFASEADLTRLLTILGYSS